MRCSKALSLVLRHEAENLGLGMSRDGFVALQDVLALPHLRGFTEGDVRGVVRYCEKSPRSVRAALGKGVRASGWGCLLDVGTHVEP